MEASCANAALAAIKANVDQLRSRVNTPSIALEKAAALMQEMYELQKLINSSS